MKTLHLLLTGIKEWFTKDIKCTLTIVISMCLSLLCLITIMTLLGADLFPTIKQEQLDNRTYYVEGETQYLALEQLRYLFNNDDLPKLDINGYKEHYSHYPTYTYCGEFYINGNLCSIDKNDMQYTEFVPLFHSNDKKI